MLSSHFSFTPELLMLNLKAEKDDKTFCNVIFEKRNTHQYQINLITEGQTKQGTTDTASAGHSLVTFSKRSLKNLKPEIKKL